MLQIENPVVSVEWLHKNLEAENLIILDGTIKKVTASANSETEKKQLPNAIFFDIKKVFSDVNSELPNTIPSQEHFEEQAQLIGVKKDSCIVVYDDLGIYSAARVWWLFKTFGFKNIAVLNGGKLAWEKAGFPTEIPKERDLSRGDFKAVYHPEKYTNTAQVLANIESKAFFVADARSSGRFNATIPEPRKDLRGGHIPNSNSLPFTEVQEDGAMKSKGELTAIFNTINPEDKDYIFTCGSGITACILALGLEIAGQENYAVYDGSWTEWASTETLPIEK